MTINKASPGNHTYQVATEYTQGAPAANLPEATILVHVVAPARSVAYLTKNNGVGSAAAAALHLGETHGLDLGTVAEQDALPAAGAGRLTPDARAGSAADFAPHCAAGGRRSA